MRTMPPVKLNWFALWRHRRTVLGLVTRIAEASDAQNQRALCHLYGRSREDMNKMRQAAREVAGIMDRQLPTPPESMRYTT
jgi:hypothetical protein